jgi:hypothetical protein
MAMARPVTTYLPVIVEETAKKCPFLQLQGVSSRQITIRVHLIAGRGVLSAGLAERMCEIARVAAGVA